MSKKSIKNKNKENIKATINNNINKTAGKSKAAVADTLKDKELENKIISKSVEKMKDRSGRLSYDDFNDILPQNIVSPDQIDDLISMLGEKDIDLGRDTSSIFIKAGHSTFAGEETFN